MKRTEIVLTGRIPSKKNSKVIVCRGKRPFLIPNSKFTAWHKDASFQLLTYGLKQLENIHIVELNFWMPDNRGADLTNKAESVMDLLVDNHIIEDDKWQVIPCILLSCEGVDKDNPRVSIVIKQKGKKNG